MLFDLIKTKNANKAAEGLNVGCFQKDCSGGIFKNYIDKRGCACNYYVFTLCSAVQQK